jgi:hypothetical protein
MMYSSLSMSWKGDRKVTVTFKVTVTYVVNEGSCLEL